MTEKRCGAPALFRYTWPGRDEMFACVEHAGGIRRVAEAMGLHLQLVLLVPQQLDTVPLCSSIVKEA